MARITKAFAIVVLIGVSVFFAITYYKTFWITEAEEEGVNTVLSKAEENKEKAEEPSPVEEIKEIPVSVYRSTLPRASVKTATGYLNNVGGYGLEKVSASYRFGSSLYVVLESRSDNCDLYCEVPNLAVARFDVNGTLTDCATLKSSYPETFLSASLYDDGLMVFATTGAGISVYTVTPEMKITRLSLNVTADKVISYYTPSGVLCAAFGSNYVSVYLIGNNLNVLSELSFSNQGANKPSALFQSGDYYLLSSTKNATKVFRFSLDGVKEIKDIPFVDDVLPVKEGYLTANAEEDKLYLYDYAFNYKDAFPLDMDGKVKLIDGGSGYLVLSYGDNKQSVSYYLCKHFEAVSRDSVDYGGIDEVEDVAIYAGSVYFTASNRNGVDVYKYDLNALNAKKVFNVEGSANSQIYLSSDGLLLVYDSANCIGDHSFCFGSSDVWTRFVKAE